mmetsp:Transcript_14639/g.31888  ORF Transcript_14639/g.31888 Transcript_14639/m.31888 type:complete len:266 (+) Transcript_14639:1170-1967(+)|eukprot:CAMPEP_0202916626 /NCGR_PEP_ID=MMETSP1392-20130828/69071_1 /ASSEMBLY_ACC=CAM_ASM_000868 /TAXON_ID=225041 /ORGANISM="Chlamydomonas chlamydogama, Strain SAG 11-48b" /LENGTH=265 /DNA_ID=CAMNT_0049609129 /DNA_START=1142 /DNA_END=1939 /DNA_ORIENTATION=-
MIVSSTNRVYRELTVSSQPTLISRPLNLTRRVLAFQPALKAFPNAFLSSVQLSQREVRASGLNPFSKGESEITPEEPDGSQIRLQGSAGAQKTLSFLAFWAQLALSLVSAGILVFSIAVVPKENVAGGLAVEVSKWLTLGGVVCSFISTFFAHGFLRLARKLESGGLVKGPWLVSNLLRNSTVNLLGIGITTISLQASVGTLVAKTFMGVAQGPVGYNPQGGVVSLDVFALQASTNTLLCHIVGLIFVNLMLRVVNGAMPKPSST